MKTKLTLIAILSSLLTLAAHTASFDRSVRTAENFEPAIPHPEQAKAVVAKLAALKKNRQETEHPLADRG
jgi:arylsulfatase